MLLPLATGPAHAGQAAAPGAGLATGSISFDRLHYLLGESRVDAINADGSDERTIVDDALYPLWSPDGTKLLFERDTTLWVLTSSRVATRITHRGAAVGAGTATWAPDGSALAYETHAGDGGLVRVVPAAGGRSRVLGRGDSPAWSPDGKWIAFVRRGWLCVIRPDGAGLRRLSKTGPTDGHQEGEPRWSPDSRRISYWRLSAEAGYSSLRVISVDGKDRRQLTNPISHLGASAWAPNGEEIAFASERKLELVSSSGGPRREVAEGLIDDYAWSPDGFAIVYVGGPGADDEDLLVVSRDGAVTQKVLDVDDATAAVSNVQWLPRPTEQLPHALRR
jgi:Tol biopolymer transport system component